MPRKIKATTSNEAPRKTRSVKPKVAPSFVIQSSEELLGLEKRDSINEDPNMPSDCSKMLLVGPSESGKSTILFNMILKGKLTWDMLYIFSKSIDDDDYQALLDELEDRFIDKGVEIDDYVYTYTDLTDLPDVDSFPRVEDPNIPEEEQHRLKHLVVIDDYGNDSYLNTNEFENWMDRCRHRNIQIILVAHTFTNFAPKIRRRLKQFVLMEGSLVGHNDLTHAHEHIGAPLDLKTFKRLYKAATPRKHGFMYIDIKCTDVTKRFRAGFDQFFSKSLFPQESET